MRVLSIFNSKSIGGVVLQGGGASLFFSRLVSILDMLKIKEKQREPGHGKIREMKTKY